MQIGLLHKASRLDPGAYDSQLQRAEEAADQLRSYGHMQDTPPGHGCSPNSGSHSDEQQSDGGPDLGTSGAPSWVNVESADEAPGVSLLLLTQGSWRCAKADFVQPWAT